MSEKTNPERKEMQSASPANKEPQLQANVEQYDELDLGDLDLELKELEESVAPLAL